MCTHVTGMHSTEVPHTIKSDVRGAIPSKASLHHPLHFPPSFLSTLAQKDGGGEEGHERGGGVGEQNVDVAGSGGGSAVEGTRRNARGQEQLPLPPEQQQQIQQQQQLVQRKSALMHLSAVTVRREREREKEQEREREREREREKETQ